ncbi:MAG: GNAT family N-acetyltransferase [Atopobiaceae bacterium]|jgi:GNAT superfamily N-acetyltransferase|nr:GNAT family N-acetyltransferase [Atopobiaceae bacterium]
MGNIRPATSEDLARCMDIYCAAQEFMVRAGNPNQWQPGFPTEEMIAEDISAHHLMVWTDEKGVPQGSFAFLPGPEPDYAEIYEGEWHDEGRYDVVHRFAAARQGLGIGTAMMQWALRKAQAEGVAVRIDTHRENIPMQGLIKSCGFTYCGVIHLRRNGEERLAFTHTF